MGILAHNNKIIIAPNRKALLPPQSGGGELPAEYQEVEWLQSDGTGYINTKYVITPNSKIEMNFDASTYTGFSVLLGAEHGSPNIYSGLSIGSTNINLMSGTGSGSNAVGVAYEAASINKIMVDGIELTVNESSASIPTPGLYPSEPAYFLARNSYGSVHNITMVKVHSLKIDGIKWFLCYRISDSVVGVYNPAKSEFLPGTGTIAKGPDIISAQDLLARLEAIL